MLLWRLFVVVVVFNYCHKTLFGDTAPPRGQPIADGTKHIQLFFPAVSRLMHVVFLSLDLFTANGAAGSEQTEVGLGFGHAT